MWARLQRWAFDRYGEEELNAALVEHLRGRGVGTPGNPADEDDLMLSLGWLLIDRPLACGDTPASLYAGLPELPERERWLAGRIASSRLGVHRVVDADPGAWMELEDVLTGTRARVDSPNASLAAVRWQILICRVERGGPTPVLWGGAAAYEPGEEDEILAELRRIAAATGLDTEAADLAAALTASAGEMAGFVPPSRSAERTFHTPEGDAVAFAEATWRLTDPAAALRELRATPGLQLLPDDEQSAGHVFDWLAARREVVAHQPLPPGAVILERRPVTLDRSGELRGGDLTSLGTFTVSGEVLECSCLSVQRLDGAVALVERSLGPLATDLERRIRSVEEVRGQPDPDGAGVRPGTTVPPQRVGSDATSDERLGAFFHQRWIDDPQPQLGGLSPREASGRPELRGQLERQLRTLEYRDACRRNEPFPGPDVARLRRELALEPEAVAG
jgi:hypothetical protein